MNPARTVTVDVVDPNLLKDLVARNAARVRELGMGPMSIAVGPVRVGARKPANSAAAHYGVRVHPVTVGMPDLGMPAGWEMLTRLTATPGLHLEDPGHDMSPSAWADSHEAFGMGWQKACVCFHCRQPSQRTFAMKQTAPDGSSASFHLAQECLPRVVERVGGACPPNVIDRLNLIIALSEEIGQAREIDLEKRQESGLPDVFDVRYALALSHAMIRQHGYASVAQEIATAKGAHPIRSTKHRVEPLLIHSAHPRAAKPTPDDVARAEADLAWIRQDLAKRTELSDYLRHLMAAAREDTASVRDLGTIVSAPVAHVREREFRVVRNVPPAVAEGPGRAIGGIPTPPPVAEPAPPSKSAPASKPSIPMSP